MKKQNGRTLGLFILGLFAISSLAVGAAVAAAQTQPGYHTMSDGTVMNNDGMNKPVGGNANAMMGNHGMHHMMGGQLNDKQHEQMHKQCMKMMDDDKSATMHQTTDTRQ